jgi:hypothetical protein
MAKKKDKEEVIDALCKLSLQDRFKFEKDRYGEIIGYDGNSVVEFITVAYKMLGHKNFSNIMEFVSKIEKNIDECKNKV